uniref:SWIM-type domain-containing protein n=1 Tax=Coccolithus braarudii TaxID=221442 RepID=A0A7S0LSQ1_9EUKA|mmetsp:Transcript_53075/g.113461  ORF Transcript_53075/g.113461 Transcript_53075/m.113461 type:complete len:105 (+) Transcript_53075:436-750(+)
MTGRPVVPRHWAQTASAFCSCPDFSNEKGWCKHVAALGFVIVDMCDKDPFTVFKLVGLSLDDLLPKRAPVKRRIDSQAPHSKWVVIDLDSPQKCVVNLLSDDEE